MRKAARLFTLAASMALLATACGSDAPTGTNSGDLLTAQEALDVFGQLNAVVGQALGGVATGPVASPGASQDPIPTVSAECPYGGSVSISGDVDVSNLNQQTGTGSISFDLTESISSCGIMSGGYEFTVSGDPSIVIEGDIDIGTTSISGTYKMMGGFSYTSDDGRAGSCAMDVSANFTEMSVSGSVCGQSISGAS